MKKLSMKTLDFLEELLAQEVMGEKIDLSKLTDNEKQYYNIAKQIPYYNFIEDICYYDENNLEPESYVIDLAHKYNTTPWEIIDRFRDVRRLAIYRINESSNNCFETDIINFFHYKHIFLNESFNNIKKYQKKPI